MDRFTLPCEETKRIDWIDMAKGYGILLVILGHLNVGRVWIYTFHMPLFFFLSGYVFRNTHDFKIFLKRKIKALLIPYLGLGVPILLFDFCVKLFLAECCLEDFPGMVIRFLIQERMYTIWFLPCLFFVNIIAYFIVKNNTLFMVGESIFLIVLGSIYYSLSDYKVLPWNLDAAVMVVVFFIGGYIFKQLKIERYLNRNSMVWFGLALVINVVFVRLNKEVSGEGLEIFAVRYGFIPFSYISAFAGIILVLIISMQFTSRVISYLGRNSLIYFAWHTTIFIPITGKLLSVVGLTLSDASALGVVAYRGLQFIMIIIGLTFCNIFITNSKLKIILGR